MEDRLAMNTVLRSIFSCRWQYFPLSRATLSARSGKEKLFFLVPFPGRFNRQLLVPLWSSVIHDICSVWPSPRRRSIRHPQSGPGGAAIGAAYGNGTFSGSRPVTGYHLGTHVPAVDPVRALTVFVSGTKPNKSDPP